MHRRLLTVALFTIMGMARGLSFTASHLPMVGIPSAFGNHPSRSLSTSPMTMRDRSTVTWFSVGDSVRVVDDVQKAGANLRGQEGIVVQTWEKCDVDPTCCCAEEVDRGMAVHVQFPVAEEGTNETFVHYFAEEELIHIKETGLYEDEIKSETLPFDGLSCQAFKLQQLQGGKQAKRIAAFEATRNQK